MIHHPKYRIFFSVVLFLIGLFLIHPGSTQAQPDPGDNTSDGKTKDQKRKTPDANSTTFNAYDEKVEDVTLNEKAEGFNGLWYMNQPLDNEYRYKYSGGLATYTAKHRPFAVYSEEVNKTFFTFGGTRHGSHERYDLTKMGERMAETPGVLLHMVSYYDHENRQVTRPTIVMDKRTRDMHDNPVISIDDDGYIWIFSTAHGRARPSYIHRSTEPYSIGQFELVRATTKEGENIAPFTNFSYFQPWHLKNQGFSAFVTRYNYPTGRTIAFITSKDGRSWSRWQRLSMLGQGSYQVSTATNIRRSNTSVPKAGTAFNMHPSKPEERSGVNYRTNLYYLETGGVSQSTYGETWQTADGTTVEVPVTKKNNPALVHDYSSENLLVYLKDIQFDEKGRPIILYVTSKGYRSGPDDGPRTWRVAHWNGKKWNIQKLFSSDNNYDMGTLHVEEDGWRVIAPVEPGPQKYNPGGEVAMWIGRVWGSREREWSLSEQITQNSTFNHTYVRRPEHAHSEFYAFWADGDPRKPSESRLYFSSRDGKVFRLPQKMEKDHEHPARVHRKTFVEDETDDVEPKKPEDLPGLLTFWDFQEQAGEDRVSTGKYEYRLKEMNGPIDRAEDGIFGPYSASFDWGQWFRAKREHVPGLDIHGKDATLSMVSWVKRTSDRPWQFIAGMWNEKMGKRQYATFISGKWQTDYTTYRRDPTEHPAMAYVSDVGGATPERPFSFSYATGDILLEKNRWYMIAHTYDGTTIKVYVNGVLDQNGNYNPFPFEKGILDAGEEGSDFTVAQRGIPQWPNYPDGTPEHKSGFDGRMGGLAIYSRALTPNEIRSLFVSTMNDYK